MIFINKYRLQMHLIIFISAVVMICVGALDAVGDDNQPDHANIDAVFVLAVDANARRAIVEYWRRLNGEWHVVRHFAKVGDRLDVNVLPPDGTPSISFTTTFTLAFCLKESDEDPGKAGLLDKPLERVIVRSVKNDRAERESFRAAIREKDKTIAIIDHGMINKGGIGDVKPRGPDDQPIKTR